MENDLEISYTNNEKGVKKTRFILSNDNPENNNENDNENSEMNHQNSTLSPRIVEELLNDKPEIFLESPLVFKISRKNESDSEDNKKNTMATDSNSIITSSSDESDKMMKKKFEIDSKVFKRSKSTSGLFKNKPLFPIVREEKSSEEEDTEHENASTEKFKKLNLMIQQEGYDNIEEALDHKPRLLSTRSTKCLSLMDPVLEVKEEIDFNQIKFAPFKKLKYMVDVEEDTKIIGNTPNAHHFNRFEVDDAIEEDNRENDLDTELKTRKYHTHNIKKIPEFFDKSEQIKQVETKNYITEEITEDTEHEEVQEELIHNAKCI